MHQAEKVKDYKMAKVLPAEETSDFGYSQLCIRSFHHPLLLIFAQ